MNKKIRVSLVAVAVLCLCGISFAYLSFTHESAADESSKEKKMGLLKGDKVCLFSGFDGQLTLNGEPAAGAEITRVYEWKNKEHRDIVKADHEGRFAFESVWDVQRGFVVQFVSHQQIFVNYQDQETQVWGGGKLEESEFWEFGGSKPNNLRCELTESIRRVNLKPAGFIGTSCHWD